MQQPTIGILFNDFQLGGCERVAIRLANVWVSMGQRVIVYVANDVGNQRALLAAGVQVACADPLIETSRLQSQRLGQWVGTRATEDRPVAYFLPGNSYFPAARSLSLATDGAIPIFAKISNPLWREDRPWIGNAIFRLVTRQRLGKVAAVAALSPQLLRHDEQSVGLSQRRGALPDALNEQWPQNHWVRRRPWHICAVGRLVPQKNFALILRSVALLQDLPVTLTIVGDGQLMPKLQRLARRLGIERRVSFAGAVTETSAFMAEAEAMLLTSRYEGYPAVMIEAMVAGTYVVARNASCAMTEIIQSPLLGTVVDGDQPEAFAGALRRFFADPQRRACDTRRAMARQLFDRHIASHSAREYLKFFGLHTPMLEGAGG